MIKTFILFFTLAHAQNVVKGEYIVTTTEGTTEKTLQTSLLSLPPTNMRSLGANQYLLTYKADPGLPALTKLSKKSFKIQPNFVYSIKPGRKKSKVISD